jgi:hypothetical protein
VRVRGGVRNLGVRASEKMVSVEEVDFSPVRTIFHPFSPIFHPIFQLEGVGFEPVEKNTRP